MPSPPLMVLRHHHRAFGAVKSIYTGDHQTLTATYDNRMRPTSWNVSGVLGYNYSYIWEHGDKVNYAQSINDSTLDRGYEYDQVGALVFAHSGSEARAQFGINGQPWGNSDGPYSHWYDYDKQGNMTFRFGWGGEVQGGSPNGGDTTLTYSYTNNKRSDLGYDAAGNVTFDGYFNTYNASNQQTLAESGSYTLAQYYDGDGLRVTKYDNGPTTLYLRSTVLGGAVVEEIDANHNLARGYVYAGSDLLAVQSGGQVSWVHEDPITKSQRVTDASGNVINTIELDPWGANTDRSSATPFQPQNFTTYIRDGNGQQDAMARRYSPTGRFSQPDPYGGSYNFGDPQSLNRYAYTKNDPVNFRDPSGLYEACIHEAMTRFLAKRAGFSDQIAQRLGEFAGDKPGGADSWKYAATNPVNVQQALLGGGPSVNIHFASEERLQRGISRFSGYMALRTDQGYQAAAFVLHSIQDVHGAHEGYTDAVIGHSMDGPAPDRVIGDAKFIRVANETFQLLANNRKWQLNSWEINEMIDAIVKECGDLSSTFQITRPSAGPFRGLGGGGGDGGGTGGDLRINSFGPSDLDWLWFEYEQERKDWRRRHDLPT